jgi:tetratricopeptide (TPR) repeat protein
MRNFKHFERWLDWRRLRQQFVPQAVWPFWGLTAGVWFLLLMATSRWALAADPATQFDAANRLYEQGKYPQAIEAYRELLLQHQASLAVYYNLGNAYFKNGQTGEAIVTYRLAQRLAPRDPDVLANLRFARERVEGGAGPRNAWQRLLSVLTLNELTLWTAGTVWCWFVILAAGQFRREWRRSLQPLRLLAGVVVAISVLWLGAVLQNNLGAPSAVVIAKDAAVRHGPFIESQTAYTLHDGAEVVVLDRKDAWLQVRDRRHTVGWLQKTDVTILPSG